jgi:glutathione synthase/RimK-type ligase-like ATP-grasp enzyme
MSSVIIVMGEDRSSAPGHMGIADYLQKGGQSLPIGTRVLFDVPPGPWLYEGVLMAGARGHRPFPSLDDVTEVLWPRRAGDISLGKACGSRSWPERPPIVGVLYDPADSLAPSHHTSLEDLGRQFAHLQINQVVIDPTNIGTVHEIDALFVRAHTSPGSIAWRWSKAAREAGIPVIDNPSCILRCCSKLFMMESFRRHSIAAPRSVAVSCEADVQQALLLLRTPMVLKIPGGSFSRGVFRVENIADALMVFSANQSANPIMVAQEFLPTAFDWRIGVLNRNALYACRYFMAPNHWQIFKAESNGQVVEGRGQAVAVSDAPHAVVDLAVRAANCIGDGLYGVDIKVVDGQALVVEVNDNPTVETELEASIDPVWSRIARHFSEAIATQRRRPLQDARRCG